MSAFERIRPLLPVGGACRLPYLRRTPFGIGEKEKSHEPG